MSTEKWRTSSLLGGMPCVASLLMQKKVQETMNEDTYGEAQPEFPFPDFVAEYIHGKISTCRTAQRGKKKERTLPDAPGPMLRPPLIGGEGDECHEVDAKNIHVSPLPDSYHVVSFGEESSKYKV